MIILDTNVLSALMRQSPILWSLAGLTSNLGHRSGQRPSLLLRSDLDCRYCPRVKPRSSLIQAFEILLEKIGQRVAPFDGAAAQAASDLMAARHKKEQPGDLRDPMIAGIVLAQHAALATRNTSHFEERFGPGHQSLDCVSLSNCIPETVSWLMDTRSGCPTSLLVYLAR